MKQEGRRNLGSPSRADVRGKRLRQSFKSYTPLRVYTVAPFILVPVVLLKCFYLSKQSLISPKAANASAANCGRNDTRAGRNNIYNFDYYNFKMKNCGLYKFTMTFNTEKMMNDGLRLSMCSPGDTHVQQFRLVYVVHEGETNAVNVYRDLLIYYFQVTC